MDNVTIRIKSLTLLIWSVAERIDDTWASGIGGTEFGLAAIGGVLKICNVMQYFDHDELSSIFEFNKGKSRGFQNLIKFFNWATTSVFIVLLSFAVLSNIFVLYSKDFFVVAWSLFIL